MKISKLFGCGLAKLAIAASLVFGLAGAASATLIDDFSTAQPEMVVGSGQTDFNTASGAGILGGHRDITISVPSGADDPVSEPRAFVRVSGGLLRIANDPNTVSTITVAWDGEGYGGAASGLGSAGNLSGIIAVIVQVTFADLQSSVEFELKDTSNNVATAFRVIDAGQGNYFLPFSSFTGDPVDLSNLFSVVMRVTGQDAFDINIDLIEGSPIPEPSTMLLSAAALLALGFFRRRRA